MDGTTTRRVELGRTRGTVCDRGLLSDCEVLRRGGHSRNGIHVERCQVVRTGIRGSGPFAHGGFLHWTPILRCCRQTGLRGHPHVVPIWAQEAVIWHQGGTKPRLSYCLCPEHRGLSPTSGLVSNIGACPEHRGLSRTSGLVPRQSGRADKAERAVADDLSTSKVSELL